MDLSRHKQLADELPLAKPIEIIGCGSLGTIIGTTLVRMGFTEFILWDDDIVSEANIANQYFEHTDIGDSKVHALKRKIKSINPEAHIIMRGERYNPLDETENALCILTPDNMETRKLIFESVDDGKIILDIRMGAYDGRTHCFIKQENTSNLYRNTLYEDSAASNEPCTLRTIIFTSVAAAATGAAALAQVLRGKKLYTEYHLNMNTITLQEGMSIEPRRRHEHGN